MRFYPKPKVCLICLLLAAAMVRLAVWQWHRNLEKQTLIAAMEERLALPPTAIESLLVEESPPDSFIHRRVKASGVFDFDHEVVLRNRRYEGAAGVHVLTPMKIAGTDRYILVDRGFEPLSQSERESRKKYRTAPETSFIGLVKESSRPFWIAPQDPQTGPDKPWVDAWLRVDLEKISKQLPYPILPVYLETMSTSDPEKAESEIVKSSSGREELLFLGLQGKDSGAKPDVDPKLHYPVPVFDTVIPAARHLGYVYEWATMAVMTLLIGLVLQLRPPRPAK